MPNVFNPYQDVCPVHDKANAAALRRANLRAVLESVQREDVHALWVGRDLGYRGGRRTGIPLTDDHCLDAIARRFGLAPLEQPTAGSPIGERTATVVWNMLAWIEQPIMFWNVFPFHPHPADEPMANRTHTAKERSGAHEFLEAIIALTRPSCIVAIGRDAETATSAFNLPVHPVRHPSFGGQRKFEAGIAEVYGLAPRRDWSIAPSADLLSYAAMDAVGRVSLRRASSDATSDSSLLISP